MPSPCNTHWTPFASHAIQIFLESKDSITSYHLPDPDIFTFDKEHQDWRYELNLPLVAHLLALASACALMSSKSVSRPPRKRPAFRRFSLYLRVLPASCRRRSRREVWCAVVLVLQRSLMNKPAHRLLMEIITLQCLFFLWLVRHDAADDVQQMRNSTRTSSYRDRPTEKLKFQRTGLYFRSRC